MTKSYVRCACFLFFLLTALPALAQHGCVVSPENPTAILALIGVAGVCYWPVKRKLASTWRKNSDRASR